MNRRRRTNLRAGFKDDFLIFHAEVEFKIEIKREDEEVEWIDDPEKPPKIVRVNTIVALSFLSLFLSFAALIK